MIRTYNITQFLDPRVHNIFITEKEHTDIDTYCHNAYKYLHFVNILESTAHKLFDSIRNSFLIEHTFNISDISDLSYDTSENNNIKTIIKKTIRTETIICRRLVPLYDLRQIIILNPNCAKFVFVSITDISKQIIFTITIYIKPIEFGDPIFVLAVETLNNIRFFDIYLDSNMMELNDYIAHCIESI
jgi:hypothetical protein